MTPPTIEIFIKDNTWHANMGHANNAEEIKELFGTYTLPTPFMAKTSATDVAQTLARSNPGHEILVPY